MRKISSYMQPLAMIFVVDALAFVLLYLYKKSFDPLILFTGLAVMTIICISYFFNLRKDLGDEYLFIIVSMLASIGIIMLYRLNKDLGLKQVVWFAAGVVLFFMSHYIVVRIGRLDKYVFIYACTSLALFIMTQLIGTSVKGAKNWIILNGFSIQPSEIIKILFVLYIASYFKQPARFDLSLKLSERVHVKLNGKYVFAVTVYIFLIFLVLQREWGTTLLFFMVYIGMLYVYENDYKLFLLNILAALAGSVAGYLYVYHIRVRIETWLNPWKDIAGKGYQITQSLFAIGSGGFFGTGLGMGRPDMIPEVTSDFIFSAICEEFGIFGGVAVVMLFFLLVYRGLKISISSGNTFSKALALAITMMFGFQTFIIIGGVIKLIPLTGITLPFISYGGTSLIASFISLGILHAVSDKAFEENMHESDGGVA